MAASNIFRNSIIVAAHPDDEILWFSSLLGGIDHILLCFLSELVNPDFGIRRQQALSHYPLGNKMSCLNVVALGVSAPSSFLSPKFCQYGIELTDDNRVSENHKRHYKDNYFTLRGKLANVLSGYRNVVTHNPWGEYGHEEHVQVYRVIKDLQNDIGYDIWFSNYCSTRTIGLTAPMLNATDTVTFRTDHKIAEKIMNLYKKNGCWTWYEDWHSPTEETFFKESRSGTVSMTPGTVLSVNLVVMPLLRSRPVRPRSLVKRIINMSVRIFRRNRKT